MPICLKYALFFSTFGLLTAAAEVPSLIPQPLLQLGSGIYYSKFAFLVDKKKRELSLWEKKSDGNLVQLKRYDADMGKTKGDKLSDGDHKTPEGVYFLQEMLQGEKIPFELYGSRAYTTNYPNYFDSRDGKTGSGIWLHAVPDTTPLTRGSRGCVVIRNQAILEAEPYFTPKTTPIVIEDQVIWVDKSTVDNETHKIRSFLMKWLNAWQKGTTEDYLEFYHADFRGKGMNKRGWGRYKKRIKRAQKNIEVLISEPMIFESDNEITVRFMQSFKSNILSDFGEKTLYLFKDKTSNELKIYGEQWRTNNDALAKTEWQERPFNLRKNTSTALNRDQSHHTQKDPNPSSN